MWHLVRETAARLRSNCLKFKVERGVILALAVLCWDKRALGNQIVKVNFDDLKVGSELVGWQGGFLGATGTPHWHVSKDKTAPSPPNVLRQDGKAVYSWYVQPAFKAIEGTVQVSFKVESGKEDPEAGLICRFIDTKNYYYVRANILENDLIFYKMVAGKKEVVKRVETQVTANKWHKLKIEFKNDAFKVIYDDKEVMGLKDANLKGSGSTGIWTTADTVADFDDFEASGV